MHTSTLFSALPVLMIAKLVSGACENGYTYGHCEGDVVHYYDPETGELCGGLDCGGGRADFRYDVPGCPHYTGTEIYVSTPSFMPCFESLKKTKAPSSAETRTSAEVATTTTEEEEAETSSTDAESSEESSSAAPSSAPTSPQSSSSAPSSTDESSPAPSNTEESSSPAVETETNSPSVTAESSSSVEEASASQTTPASSDGNALGKSIFVVAGLVIGVAALF